MAPAILRGSGAAIAWGRSAGMRGILPPARCAGNDLVRVTGYGAALRSWRRYREAGSRHQHHLARREAGAQYPYTGTSAARVISHEQADALIRSGHTLLLRGRAGRPPGVVPQGCNLRCKTCRHNPWTIGRCNDCGDCCTPIRMMR